MTNVSFYQKHRGVKRIINLVKDKIFYNNIQNQKHKRELKFLSIAS